MEPLPPTTFPRRVKRFQSLSMTPLDYQVDFETETSNNLISSSNKINFSANNKTPLEQSTIESVNPVTNQFSFKNRKKLFQNDNSLFKNTLKAQFGSTNKQPNNPNNNSNFISSYKHRKMVSSEIFDSNSINSKNYLANKKTNQNLGFLFKSGQRGSFSSDQQVQSQQGKKPHIPSFLLNKKRMARNSQMSDYNNDIPRQMYESTPLNLSQRKEQRWKTFKDQMIINSAKSIESEKIEIFSPPSQKIAYSKATASTLCTNLPREESRRTFKDFDEMEELKQMSNSMEDCDSPSGLNREFDNLFRKEENGINGNIEDEIAQLFSDQQAESEPEEFNQDLHNELQQLF